ncbi:MAG: MoxR family ATPase [Polyangiales bacterium]
MSQPTKRNRAPRASAEPAQTTLSVPIGARVVDVLDLAHRAGRPVLLEGPTGIGKSQVVAQFAAQAGLAVTVLDLSLLEPPDLVGLPVIQGGRTHYASPAELPTEGRGVLLLEELNRAEIPVMQPALQLLSARRLHGYTLPPGWSCVAAVNPDDGEHQVNALDPALRARFLQLTVHADRDAWLAWARRENVHPVIVSVVEAHDDVFDAAPPRSWAYASDVLHEARADELADGELLGIVLRGYLPRPGRCTSPRRCAEAPTPPRSTSTRCSTRAATPSSPRPCARSRTAVASTSSRRSPRACAAASRGGPAAARGRRSARPRVPGAPPRAAPG